MSTAREIFKNEHFVITCDHSRRVVFVQRTAVPLRRASDVEEGISALVREVPAERRVGWGIVSDYRDAPLRVHPALEPVWARYRSESERGFRRAAVVVATPVGKVRGARLGEGARIPVVIVNSMEEALRFVTQP